MRATVNAEVSCVGDLGTALAFGRRCWLVLWGGVAAQELCQRAATRPSVDGAAARSRLRTHHGAIASEPSPTVARRKRDPVAALNDVSGRKYPAVGGRQRGARA